MGALAGLSAGLAPVAGAGTATATTAFLGSPGGAPNCQTAPGDTFETPVVTPGTFTEVSAGQPVGPWTVTRNNVDLIGAGFWQAADGVQSLDLNGGSPGGVVRTLDPAWLPLPLPLYSYALSYCLAGNPDSGPTVKTGQVLVNGTPVRDLSFSTEGTSRSAMGYRPETVTFASTGRHVTVEFRSTTPGAYGPVVDKVVVRKCLLGLLCS